MVRIKRNQRHSSQDAKDQRLLGYGAACRTTSEKASVNTAAIYLDVGMEGSYLVVVRHVDEPEANRPHTRVGEGHLL
ncbi:unnamed protein product [Ilex paraguariensis]|uniref:Uncharacterized protein n=1 Tax=Ilex paraguariensis TaxID=185542 RepID=A0ABC8R8B8_9AQUA